MAVFLTQWQDFDINMKIEPDQTLKICLKCKEPKQISKFNKAKTGKYGVRGNCKQCQAKQHRRWFLKHFDDICSQRKQYAKNHYKLNREVYSKHNTEYYQNNKVIILARLKKRQTKQRQKLELPYIMDMLCRQFGYLRDNLPNELIQLKLEQIRIFRLIREVKRTLINGAN